MTTKTTLSLEPLDRRDMPAINPIVGGVLTIDGGGDNDVASIALIGGQYQVKLYTYAPGSSVGIGQTINYAPGSFHQIIFNGGAGDDRFLNLTAIPCIANGGSGKDVLRGGNGNDLLRGGTQDDVLIGVGGNDILKGAAGNDTLYGRAGDDTLVGGLGHDKLYGHEGHDKLYGGDGNDHLYGGVGVDRLYGEVGADYLDGGADGLPDLLVGGNPDGDTFKAEFLGGVNLDEPTDATDPFDLVV
jgi:Ca2+-binding RTX toxin-like protein